MKFSSLIGLLDAMLLLITENSEFRLLLQMQQKLLALLEIAMIEGKARERSLSVSRSLSDTSAEVPFFDLLVANATGNDLIDVIERTQGRAIYFPIFSCLDVSHCCLETEVLFLRIS